MKIVCFAPFAFAPKATVSMRLLPMASALARRGHEVSVLIPPYDAPADSGKTYDWDGVRVENLTAREPITPASYLSLARQMAARAKDINPNVFYVFKPVGPGALAMWQMWLGGERRFVLDNDDWEGWGGWLDVNPYPALQKQVMARQEAWCLRHARAVTCASHALAQRTQEFRQTGRGEAQISIFPNGPIRSLADEVTRAQDVREQTRARLGWATSRVVVYAGTVPLNHDLDVALQAVAGLADGAREGVKLVFQVVGDGVPALKSAVAALPAVSAITEWRGFAPHEELVQTLVAADIAIYPYRDTNINRAKCSGKVIDYMGCGLPVVLSDVGMNRVYIQQGESGLLTPPGDAPAFRDALAHMLAHPQDAQRMGANARARLWQKFDWDARAEELELQLGLRKMYVK